MKKTLVIIFLAVATCMFMVAYAMATKPGEPVNPNGFPSGEHYNLNVIGKKAGFTCPAQEYDEYGNPVYGNVIYVPENGENIQILMQSGLGKKAAAITELQVTDPCAAAFDGDAALMQLPKNDLGYSVYARVLAKPTDNPSIEIIPDLIAVEDESGNDLVYLGLVTSNGFQTPYVSFTRNKGKSTALDITGLFEWSGDVCYLTSDYCNPIETCSTMSICCTDSNMDGIYESCDVKEGDFCPVDTVEVTAYCKTYVSEWVFNIGDFVTYLWNLDNAGVKLLQVRFYPVK